MTTQEKLTKNAFSVWSEEWTMGWDVLAQVWDSNILSCFRVRAQIMYSVQNNNNNNNTVYSTVYSVQYTTYVHYKFWQDGYRVNNERIKHTLYRRPFISPNWKAGWIDRRWGGGLLKPLFFNQSIPWWMLVFTHYTNQEREREREGSFACNPRPREISLCKLLRIIIAKISAITQREKGGPACYFSLIYHVMLGESEEKFRKNRGCQTYLLRCLFIYIYLVV